MLFKTLAIFFGLAALAAADPDIQITLHRWNTTDCSGPIVGSVHHIESPDCKNFEHEFRSFSYDPYIQPLSNDVDFDAPGCQVVVYGQPDCKGNGFSAGSFRNTFHECIKPLEGTAASASVHCERDSNAVEGIIEEGSFAHYVERE